MPIATSTPASSSGNFPLNTSSCFQHTACARTGSFHHLLPPREAFLLCNTTAAHDESGCDSDTSILALDLGAQGVCALYMNREDACNATTGVLRAHIPTIRLEEARGAHPQLQLCRPDKL
ncbi:hypothetical protein KC359_g17 [Hortaea werneckii]|nr:hypothetical protein KC359_g17 [Hortaea werneckii]